MIERELLKKIVGPLKDKKKRIEKEEEVIANVRDEKDWEEFENIVSSLILAAQVEGEEELRLYLDAQDFYHEGTIKHAMRVLAPLGICGALDAFNIQSQAAVMSRVLVSFNTQKLQKFFQEYGYGSYPSMILYLPRFIISL